jgi:hypothetical protein
LKGAATVQAQVFKVLLSVRVAANSVIFVGLGELGDLYEIFGSKL